MVSLARPTSSPIVPIHDDRPLEQALTLLELPQRIATPHCIFDDAAGFRWTDVFEDAGYLIGCGRALLDICFRLSAALNFITPRPVKVVVLVVWGIPSSNSVLSTLL